MQTRQYVPFDVFGMREQVRVSTLVRVGSQGWTCGQCPLDTNAQVVAPGDLIAQSEFVCTMIHTVLARGGFKLGHAAQLILYHAAPNGAALDTALAVFRQAFPHGPVILPVPVPHFYYAGMLLEVDAFADETLASLPSFPAPGVQRLDGEALAYIAVEANTAAKRDATLAALGLGEDQVLQDLTIAPVPKTDPFAPAEGKGRGACILYPGAAPRLSAHATAAIVSRRDPVQSQVSDQGVWIRETPSTVVLSAPRGRAGDSLVTQTRLMMAALDQALMERELTWAHVVKISAPYAGDSSAQALHENLTIRHGYHALPGPASTGLPVSGFAHPDTRIFIQLIARR